MSAFSKLTGALSAIAVIVGITAAGASGPAQAAPTPAGFRLPGSAAPFTARTTVRGNVAASTRLSVQLWLKPRLAAAQSYATAVSTPGNPLSQHYLSPDAYAARFGAPRAAVAAVESWLRAEGFTAVGADAERTYVRATATARTINAAFRVRLRLYKSSSRVNAGPYALRANDRPVWLPASSARRVLGVTGLDNAAPILPLQMSATRPAGGKPGVPCSSYYGQHEISGLPRQFGTTKFATDVCGYSPDQIRAAYRASSRDTGTGQTIALVEAGLARHMFSTLHDYATRNNLPAPSRQRYTEVYLGKNRCGDPSFGEEQLDVEASYVMAPGAHQVVVGGDSCDNGRYGAESLLDAETAILNGSGGRPLASVASNSWGFGPENEAPALINIEHAILVRAAAEGVGMYFAAGDGSGAESPSDDPFAVAVGGTNLGIGKTGNRLFETGWSTGASVSIAGKWVLLTELGATGGGPSLLWKQPAYQRGVVPPTLARAPGSRRGGPVRSVPDISADADPATGMTVGLLLSPKPGAPLGYTQLDTGGTSLATPLVAGMVIAAQQGQAAPFGFTDPAFYKLAGTAAFFPTLPLTNRSPALDRGEVCPQRPKMSCPLPPPPYTFDQLLFTFDDQSVNMGGYTGQVTLPGYDNMTGLGTPDGPNFIKALRKLEK